MPRESKAKKNYRKRKDSLTLDQINERAAKLLKLHGEYDGFAKQLRASGRDEIPVDGLQKFPDGLDLLVEFLTAMENGFNRVKRLPSGDADDD